MVVNTIIELMGSDGKQIAESEIFDARKNVLVVSIWS